MKLLLKGIVGILPVGWKKKLIEVVVEWAVKSTKTKIDDKLWAKIKDKI